MLKIIGISLYSVGLILRYWSLILLGQNFSRDVEVSEEQELVSHGTYKYVHHPLYLGLYLLTIAVPLYVGNIVIFLLFTIIMFIAISIGIKEMHYSNKGSIYGVVSDKNKNLGLKMPMVVLSGINTAKKIIGKE